MSAQIRSDRLRKAMAVANLSAKALTRRAKARGRAVSERAIARYCQGEAAVHGLWPRTLEALAKALDAEVGYLTGEAPETPGQPAPSAVVNETRWQIRMPTRIRNFYQLIEWRYRVSAVHIAEIAPLLFVLAAEMSLAERRRLLRLLREASGARSALASQMAHLPGGAFTDVAADEVYDAEQQSIERRDVFGITLWEDRL